MSSNTDNLKLLKANPVEDGNDVFNIDTFLNANWDKVDNWAGEVDTQLNEIANPNLLINGDFINSINQRNITSISEETVIKNGWYNYFIDRWFYQYLGLKANITVDGNGILIQSTGNDGSENPCISIGQPLDTPYKVFANKNVTLSFDIETNSKVRLIFAGHDKNFTRIIPDKYFEGSDSNILKERIYITGKSISEFNDSFARVTIALYNSGYLRIKNAKLEFGSKPTMLMQRLYGEELALCKRFFKRVLGSGYGYVGIVIMTSPTLGYALIPSSNMRIYPNLSYSGSFRLFKGVASASEPYSVTALKLNQWSSEYYIVEINLVDNTFFKQGDVCALIVRDGAYIDLDSEIY